VADPAADRAIQLMQVKVLPELEQQDKEITVELLTYHQTIEQAVEAEQAQSEHPVQPVVVGVLESLIQLPVQLLENIQLHIRLFI
jgi:hypothetical protein